ncbi:MAG TPA: cytochrome c oxidase assembly protein [Dehalococcoidia bacterium]|nr:cytochrome c oxidase assembly protein [Dehalococcoidia bacterium]
MFALLHAADGPYQFHWDLHSDVVLLCIFLQAGYLYAVTQLRPVVSDAGRVRRRQMLLFTAGVLSIYLVSGTPVHEISEQYLLSMHMFQHGVYTLIAAPLLLAGIPGWLWQAVFRWRPAFIVARYAFHPLIAFGVFNAVLVASHLPPVVDLALNEHWFHFAVHATIVVTAMMMWWPILSNVPELPRLTAPLAVAYLFLQSIVPAVVASFVTFAHSAVYEFYGNAPRIWGISPVEDQQIGGGVMKLMGTLILWGFMTVIFFQWYDREQKRPQKDEMWEGVEQELQALGLDTRDR